jgi:pilus assembly protein Flp/PilA
MGTKIIDLLTRIERRGRSERGASLVEYALLVALVAVVCIGAVTFLGNSGSTKLTRAGAGMAGEEGPQTCSEVMLGSPAVPYARIYDSEGFIVSANQGTCADAGF